MVQLTLEQAGVRDADPCTVENLSITSFFFKLFFYFWLCWVFVSVRGFSLVAASGGATLHRGARASHCCGLSCGAQAPDAQAQ